MGAAHADRVLDDEQVWDRSLELGWASVSIHRVRGRCAFGVEAVLDVTRGQLLAVRLQPGRGGHGGGGGGLFLSGRGSSPLWFLHETVMYIAVLTAGIARDYVFRERARREEAAALQVQLTEARLDALRMQLNPHFLFNTLHAISALVERDPAGVRKMITRLSELLRYTLDQGSRAEVPLEKELAFVRGYLEIMKIRFQGSLEIVWEVEPGVERALVPTLILQPLVENSIKHGVSSNSGRVEIRVRRGGSRLILTVADSGSDAPVASVEPSSGVGLRNTEERLRQMYGELSLLQLRTLAGGGTEATIEIPWRDAGEGERP